MQFDWLATNSDDSTNQSQWKTGLRRSFLGILLTMTNDLFLVTL
jgi:hypothetical protein